MSAPRVSRTEWLSMSAVIVAWGLAAIAAGKDTGWDFRNYHWYDAYALLHGRMGFDLAVAHHATYYNPLIHVPFYLIATHAHAWVALFYLGALQGLNIIPLYLMGRSALRPDLQRWGAPVLATAGVLGSTAVTMVGKTSYDHSLLSALVLSTLAVLVIGRTALLERTGACWRVAALAGLLVGLAVGFKLVTAPFGFGMTVVLLALPGTAALRATRLAAGAGGAIVGVALTGGFWFLTLARTTGNPIFPYFNHIIGSPLVGGASFVDQRFIPATVWETVAFPFRYLADYRVADDGAFRDLRVTMMYLLIPLAALLLWTRRAAREPLVTADASRILFVFVAASYVAWLPIFGIYRYIVSLEMLGPLVITAAVGLWMASLRARLLVVGVLLALSAAVGHYDFSGRAPSTDPYVQVQGLRFEPGVNNMVLMTGHEPMAYLIPEFPPHTPVLRIDGWLAGPDDGSVLTATMRARVAAFSGQLLLLYSAGESDAAQSATAAYGLAIVDAGCQTVTTNMDESYQLCPLRRLSAS